MTSSNASHPIVQAIRPPGWYALLRFVTLNNASPRGDSSVLRLGQVRRAGGRRSKLLLSSDPLPAGTPWNALVRLRTPFYTLLRGSEEGGTGVSRTGKGEPKLTAVRFCPHLPASARISWRAGPRGARFTQRNPRDHKDEGNELAAKRHVRSFVTLCHAYLRLFTLRHSAVVDALTLELSYCTSALC